MLDGIVTGEQAALHPVPPVDPRYVELVLRAFAGRVGGHWVDQLNRSHFPRRTVIKDVRGVELVSDVRTHAPLTPIIVLLRHPFDVAASVVRLGWYDQSLTPQQAFGQEVERWCASHTRALRAWHALSTTDHLTHWTTYEELTGAFSGDSLHAIVAFLTSHDATWNALATHHRNLDQRSATDFAGEPVVIADEWRKQAYEHMSSSAWHHLYDENGAQRLSIKEFLVNAAQ